MSPRPLPGIWGLMLPERQRGGAWRASVLSFREIKMENWLPVAVGVYLIAMILYGHYRGFIKLAVSATALILTLFVVRAAMPQVTGFLREHTKLYTALEENMSEVLKIDGSEAETEGPTAERQIIEGLKLPKQLKDALLENNNSEVYQVLGVQSFTQYLARYIANSIINIIGFLLLFVLLFAGINIITIWLDLVAKLPFLSGMNKIAGAVLGGLEGILFLWILGLFVTVFSGTALGRIVTTQIENSIWLSFIYNHNLLNGMIMSVVKTIL